MKKNTKILLFIVVLALLSTGVAVAINGGWFNWVPNFSDLDESDRRMEDIFILEDLPEYFTASVFVEGSGYTGQLHTIDILISHNRLDDSVNIAAGDYSLDLELTEGTSLEQITFGTFTGLRNTAPFIVSGQSWIPLSTADTYGIVLSLSNIVWSLLPEYTIISSAGAGGTISPLGSTTVNEGDDKTFTISPDTGYELEDLVIDETLSVFSFGMTSHTFENVHQNYIIHATFSSSDYTITATAGTGGSISPSGETIVPYGVSQEYTITPETGYEILDVVVDSTIHLGPVTSYPFETVTADHTIEATFVEMTETISDNRIKITINQADIDEDLSNFPVLIYLSTASGINDDDVSLIFDELGSDANQKKIAITTSDGTTQCYVEIDKWDHASEEAWLWVNVPSISSSVDTELYLYYDSTLADNTAYVGDPGDAVAYNVWDANFAAVWHFGNGTAGELDSTSNDNDLTQYGNVDQVDGKIGKCRDFLGTDDYFMYVDADLGIGSSPFTVEHWFNADAVTEMMLLYTYKSTRGLYTSLAADGSLAAYVSANASASATSGIEYVPGTWYYYVFTRDDAGNIEIFLDTESKGTDTGAGGSVDVSGYGYIGISRSLDFDYYGQLDETRVSNSYRNSAWIKASYETQRDDLLDFVIE